MIFQAKKRKMGLLEDDEKELSIEEVKGIDVSTGIVNARDNSDRAFYKELVKVIEASDVILEVLDARDPLGTRCVDMETMVMKSGPDKHLVLLLNKIDLVPREAVEKWLKYLREELPAVAFKCSTQEQRSNLGWKSSKAMKPSNLLQTSDCLGAETLIKLLKNYSRSHEIKKSITVGVIGLPNVGKSSLINSLKRCHVVNVGATPGLTRSMQEVQLDKNVKLLDCPGVVMLKSSGNDASIALRNCKRIEKLDDPVAPATVRGKLKKGGIVDVEAAARIILHDWNEGKIPYYTMPPGRNQEEPSEARIVTELGKEFNVDEVYNTESSFIGSLKSADDFHSVQVPPSHPLNFDETILEDNARPLPSTEVDESQEIISDEPMASEEHDAEKAKSKSTTSKQNEKLYAVEGMFNPKMKRAENKRKKKAKNKSTLGGDAMDDEGDYDFGVDYVKGKGQNTCGVPMSGIEVDE
ncbi:hypothetical protein Gotri_018445 [Gossypium trilobum]|uniref:CP-type G domain-containing protein n=1 Tax=Gossypium trilobum TaxID=34281 RepID=A0A7J9EB31_9ROSI|nr:hypothetical protein [Gossypium trilobum]